MELRVVLACGAAAALALGSAVPLVRRFRRSPEEKERRRRELIGARGRVIEGYVTTVQNGSIEYSYEWRGVRYEASQDVSDIVPSEQDWDYSGPVSVKFLRDRPSNSIVLNENWSGVPGIPPKS